MKRLTIVSLFSVVVLSVASLTSAADWGSLKGKFVLDGKAPKAAAINVNKDPEECGKHDLKNETFLVSSEGGIANVLVFLKTKKGKDVAVHPDYAASAKDEVVLDNKDCRFEPHICIMRAKQTLVVKNSDAVGHNTNCKLMKNPKFNEMIPSGTETKKLMKKGESVPAAVSCNIHPWMNGYVVVRNNPYVVISAEDGTFEIKNIPDGKHEFIFWHESKGGLKGLKLGGGKTKSKGKIKLTIKAGETLDLGEVKVPAKLLGL